MAAEASRHDEIAIEASAGWPAVMQIESHDARMGRHWIRHGEAILARFPDHPELEARIAASRGIVLAAEGRLEEAVARGTARASPSRHPLFGPSKPDVGESVNNSPSYLHELGRDDEAEASIRKAHAIFVRDLRRGQWPRRLRVL